MGYIQDSYRAGQPSERLVVIPVTLLGLIVASLFLIHWQTVARMGPPPPQQFFDGLPIAGSLRDARREGFTTCIDFNNALRCRRDGVMLLNQGPFNAAVDLIGGDGRGGFRQITLWHNQDQDIAIDIGRALKRQGWQSCLTSLHDWGDQHILRRKGSPVRVSIDLSYYGKRRIRIMPETMGPEPECI